MTSNIKSTTPLYKPKTVLIAGAGPGAVDLMTLRCQRALEEAEIIVYAGSLVNPEVLKFASPESKIHDSAAMTLDEMVAVMIAGIQTKKRFYACTLVIRQCMGRSASRSTLWLKSGLK